MVERRLGARGPVVSPIGFGAFKIGRNEKMKYAAAYPLPDDATASLLLNELLDAGITYFDTAPAYGLSEMRIGAALAHRRGEFTLSTKVGETFERGASTYDFSRAAVEASVQRSLKRLRTDVLDLVFVHAHGDDLAIQSQTDVVAALAELRKRGLVRGIGLSATTVGGAQAALAWADVLMLEYHVHNPSQQPIIAAAAAAGIGVVVKKGLASGKLPAADAIRFVLSNPGVASLLIGSLSVEHMRENLALAESL